MPIITPAYPSMCATHNVTLSTKEIIHRELRRGGNIADKIMTGKAPWKDLFEKHTFFTQDYKYYLSIISASTTKEAQKRWSGCVESKVRLLVVNLESHESLALAHPFNKGFERVLKCSTDEEIEQAKSGSLEHLVKGVPTASDPNGDASNGDSDVKDDAVNGDHKPSTDDKTTTVYTTTHYIGLELLEGKWSYTPHLDPSGLNLSLHRHWNQTIRPGRPTTPPANIHRCQIAGSFMAGIRVQKNLYRLGQVRP